MSVAAPQGAAYERNPVVWDLMTRGLTALPQHMPRGEVEWCHDPVHAVKDADYIVTDTWYVRKLGARAADVYTGFQWVMKRRRTNAYVTLPDSR